MDTTQLNPANPPHEPGRTGRTKRVVASAAAGAVLLGGGAAIGIAMTGGASAATSADPSTTSPGTTAGQAAGHKCAQLALGLKRNGHPVAAHRIAALCKRPLLRLAVVGGTHGQVTFETKNGARTLAFERGTIASVSGSVLTVTARDGVTWTWDLTSGTTIRSGGQKVTSSSLSGGEQIFVGGPVSGSTNDATLIRIRKNAS
jgi:hypothetical protein